MRTRLILFSLGLFGLVAGCTTTHTRHPDFGTDCADLRPDGFGGTNVDCVTVFYGTNRTVSLPATLAENDERDTLNVSPDNADRLSLGRADVWLPALVDKGGMRLPGETPQLKGSVPDDKAQLSKYVFLTRITAHGKQRFVDDLEDAVWETGDGSILLFVHGFNVAFEPALIRAAQLSTDLSRDGAFNAGTPVLYSWPSNGKMSPSYYMNDRERSAASAPHLEAFLDILTNHVDIERINIIAHSMGNRLLTKALEAYAEDYLERENARDIEFRIILAAADVDSDIFDQTTGILDNLDANVTIYTSDNDRALQVSSLLNRRPRLGDTNGNRPYIRANDRYQTVDATAVATELFGLGHGYYSDNPFVLGDMLCTLFEADPEDRALRPRRYADDPASLEYFQVDANKEPLFEECRLVRDTRPNDNPDIYIAKGKSVSGRGSAAQPPPIVTAPSPVIRQLEVRLVQKPLTLYYTRDAFDITLFEEQILEAVGNGELQSVAMTAHTDRVGTPDKNQAASQAIIDELAAWFVDNFDLDSGNITANAAGETQPAIPTRDGFPASANNRVELTLFVNEVVGD